MNQTDSILMTGITGSLGSVLAERILKSGHRIRAVVREQSQAKASARTKQILDIVGTSYNDQNLEVILGDVPDALIAGRAFNYRLRVKNPSPSVIGVRLIVTLVTEDGVSEITNEQHEIGPRDDRQLELSLVPMTESKEKASIKVEVYYGSKAIASKIYSTRVY